MPPIRGHADRRRPRPRRPGTRRGAPGTAGRRRGTCRPDRRRHRRRRGCCPGPRTRRRSGRPPRRSTAGPCASRHHPGRRRCPTCRWSRRSSAATSRRSASLGGRAARRAAPARPARTRRWRTPASRPRRRRPAPTARPRRRRGTSTGRRRRGRRSPDRGRRSSTVITPDPRVDHDLDDVDGQVGQDDAQRPEQHRAEDQRHVGGHDRVDRQLADPRPREDPLDDDDAAEEEPRSSPTWLRTGPNAFWNACRHRTAPIARCPWRAPSGRSPGSARRSSPSG